MVGSSVCISGGKVSGKFEVSPLGDVLVPGSGTVGGSYDGSSYVDVKHEGYPPLDLLMGYSEALQGCLIRVLKGKGSSVM